MSADRHGVTRRIAAPASAIFKIVADPAGHVAIDGSGMLETAPDARPLTEVGQTFDMAMDRTPLADIPGLVKYSVRNIVTQLVPDRLVEWTVGLADGTTVDHVYGWQLEPVGDHETDVTNYCDWTNISPEMRAKRSWPVVPLAMLEASVVKLDHLATGSAKPA
ncbi:MAG: polyketide cyclase [Acidimicrobiales bacterium]